MSNLVFILVYNHANNRRVHQLTLVLFKKKKVNAIPNLTDTLYISVVFLFRSIVLLVTWYIVVCMKLFMNAL